MLLICCERKQTSPNWFAAVILFLFCWKPGKETCYYDSKAKVVVSLWFRYLSQLFVFSPRVGQSTRRACAKTIALMINRGVESLLYFVSRSFTITSTRLSTPRGEKSNQKYQRNQLNDVISYEWTSFKISFFLCDLFMLLFVLLSN